jgi:hypothetical protein
MCLLLLATLFAMVLIRLTTTAAAKTPKEIRVGLVIGRNETAIGQDNLHGQNLVSRHAVQAGQWRVTSPRHVSTGNANGLQ